MRVSLTVAIAFAFAIQLHAQADSTFALETVISSSIQATQYEQIPTAQSLEKRFTGSAFVGRIIWRPNHLLGVGLQSGYLTFSNERLMLQGNTQVASVDVSLTAIPVQFVLSMNPGQFDFGIGIGGYVLQSIWRIGDDPKVNSTDVEYGVNSWAGFEFDVVELLTIGPEISLHVLSNRGIASLAVGVRIRYDVLRY